MKHTGKYHIVKVESRQVGKINLNYQSAELRVRLPISKNFSISAGTIYRTHDRPYGYNPIEIWLNETDENNNPVNPWYTLGFQYGYTDHYTTYTDATTGEQVSDWIWKDADGNIVAHTDLEFREEVFTILMNRYNQERWNGLQAFAEIAPIVGFDYYYYKSNFWLHAYGNYILPYHKYIQGDKDISYLNRNNWGKGGLKEDSEPEQWKDYSAGISLGTKITRNLGVFIEGTYNKYWNREWHGFSAGLNYRVF